MTDQYEVTPIEGQSEIQPQRQLGEGLSGDLVESRGETSAVAVAARAKALVESRYLKAAAHPRDIERVRQRILKDCMRPGFADAMTYEIKRGGSKITGLTIRFAEAVWKHFGNVGIEVSTLFDDLTKRIVSVTITDYETGSISERSITIEKTVERHSAKGREQVGIRKNAEGKTVYIVRATDDEILEKENRLCAKVIRNEVLRLLPGDIREEAIAVGARTRGQRDQSDPDSARRQILDAFFTRLGIDAAEVQRYLGHSTESMTPAEVADLRGVFASIQEGEVRWQDAVTEAEASRRKAGEKETVDATAKPPASGTRARDLMEAERAEAAAAAAASKAEEQPEADDLELELETEDPAKVEDKPAASSSPSPASSGGAFVVCTRAQVTAIVTIARKLWGLETNAILPRIVAEQWSFGKVSGEPTAWAELSKDQAGKILSDLQEMKRTLEEEGGER